VLTGVYSHLKISFLKSTFPAFLPQISGSRWVTNCVLANFVKSDYKMDSAQKQFNELYAQLQAKNYFNFGAKNIALSTQSPLFFQGASSLITLIDTLETKDDPEALSLLDNVNRFFYYSLKKLISNIDMNPEACARLLAISKALYNIKISTPNSPLPGVRPFAGVLSRAMVCMGIASSFGEQKNSEKTINIADLFSMVNKEFAKQKQNYATPGISNEDATWFFQILQTVATLPPSSTDGDGGIFVKNKGSKHKSIGEYILYYGIPAFCGITIIILIIVIFKTYSDTKAKIQAVEDAANKQKERLENLNDSEKTAAAVEQGLTLVGGFAKNLAVGVTKGVCNAMYHNVFPELKKPDAPPVKPEATSVKSEAASVEEPKPEALSPFKQHARHSSCAIL
jgi:hypothetical protein